MRLTHLGHATVLVEVHGTRVLIDPGAFSTGWETLQDLDAVVLTHEHPDHVDRERLPGLLAGNEQARILSEPGLAAALGADGVRAEPLHPGDGTDVGEVRVGAHGGEHALIHADVPVVGNIGVVISGPGGGPTFFHPGDSYAAVPDGVDILAVPLVAPWAAVRETVDFVRAVAPKVAFPVHDAILDDTGRQLYLRLLTSLTGTDVRDLRGAQEVEIDL